MLVIKSCHTNIY